MQNKESSYLEPKKLCLDIFGCNSEKLFSYLKSVTYSSSNCKVLCKNKNSLIWIKKVIKWVFGATILKKIAFIWNQCPWISLIAKLDAKIKIFKFGFKSILFGYFSLEFENIIVIFEISVIKFLLMQSCKKIILKFEMKNVFLEYFGAGTWN